jgi:TolA-binding protein
MPRPLGSGRIEKWSRRRYRRRFRAFEAALIRRISFPQIARMTGGKRRSMRLVLAGLLAALVLAGLSPAQAQVESREGIQLQNQILELRHQLQMLRDQISAGGGSALGSARQPPPSYPPPSGTAADVTSQLLERVSRLEDEVRRLRGRIDEVNNALQQQNADLSKQIQDLNFKLGNASPPSGKAAAITPVPPPAAPAAPNAPAAPAEPPTPAAPRHRPPELALQEGNAALARRDYSTAEADAREVLAGPRSPRDMDARFLLARALAGKRDYANAAVAYDDAYKASRTGPHAQDSLLGLASSLSTLGEKRAACATLDQLKAEFPTPRPDLREQISAVRQQAACR